MLMHSLFLSNFVNNPLNKLGRSVKKTICIPYIINQRYSNRIDSGNIRRLNFRKLLCL